MVFVRKSDGRMMAVCCPLLVLRRHQLYVGSGTQEELYCGYGQLGMFTAYVTASITSPFQMSGELNVQAAGVQLSFYAPPNSSSSRTEFANIAQRTAVHPPTSSVGAEQRSCLPWHVWRALLACSLLCRA